jgi:organic hydroperoxide reductase OsmC/OhrA
VSRHVAEIVWRSDRAFASGRYSRRHELRFDGGAIVTGSSSPDVVPAPLSDPAGVDPEEMLVASAASCHMLWF